MDKLYAPWRQAYADKVDAKVKPASCIFCQAAQTDDDKKYFIIRRYESCLIVLNTYPYNAGHVMVVPTKHCADLTDLSAQERTQLMQAITDSVELLKIALKPDAFNIGLNMGAVAGAGIPDHLHIHVLPRWQGDTNFLPLLGDTKQISFDLHEIYTKLLATTKRTKTSKKERKK